MEALLCSDAAIAVDSVCLPATPLLPPMEASMLQTAYIPARITPDKVAKRRTPAASAQAVKDTPFKPCVPFIEAPVPKDPDTKFQGISSFDLILATSPIPDPPLVPTEVSHVSLEVDMLFIPKRLEAGRGMPTPPSGKNLFQDFCETWPTDSAIQASVPALELFLSATEESRPQVQLPWMLTMTAATGLCTGTSNDCSRKTKTGILEGLEDFLEETAHSLFFGTREKLQVVPCALLSDQHFLSGHYSSQQTSSLVLDPLEALLFDDMPEMPHKTVFSKAPVAFEEPKLCLLKPLPALTTLYTDVLASELVPPQRADDTTKFLAVPLFECAAAEKQLLYVVREELILAASKTIETGTAGVDRGPLYREILESHGLFERLARVLEVSARGYVPIPVPPTDWFALGEQHLEGIKVQKGHQGAPEGYLNISGSTSPLTAASKKNPDDLRKTDNTLKRKLHMSVDGTCESEQLAEPKSRPEGGASKNQRCSSSNDDSKEPVTCSSVGVTQARTRNAGPSTSSLMKSGSRSETSDVQAHPVALPEGHQEVLSMMEEVFQQFLPTVEAQLKKKLHLHILDPDCKEILQAAVSLMKSHKTHAVVHSMAVLHATAVVCQQFSINMATLYLESKMATPSFGSHLLKGVVDQLQQKKSQVETGLLLDHPKLEVLESIIVHKLQAEESATFAVVGDAMAFLSMYKLLTQLQLAPFELDQEGKWPDPDQDQQTNAYKMQVGLAKALEVSKCLLIEPRSPHATS